MEITNALLVAMMFVVLLTIGIGNIIMALAALIDRRTPIKPDAIHTSWVALLLMVHFNLFWHVLDILTIQEWNFLEFLYIVAGAMLLFFATHVLLPEASSAGANDLRAHYFENNRQFFFFFGLVQAWIIGVDFILRHGFTITAAGALNLVVFALAAILALSSVEKVHRLGTAAGWVLLLVSLILQSTKEMV